MFDCFDKDKFQYPIDWNEYQDVRTGRDRSNRIFGESLEKMSDVALLHFVGRCLHGLLMDTDAPYAKEAAKDKLDKLLIETVFRNNFRVFVSGNDGIAEVSKDLRTEHALTDKIDWKKWEENRTVIGWGNFGKYGDQSLSRNTISNMTDSHIAHVIGHLLNRAFYNSFAERTVTTLINFGMEAMYRYGHGLIVSDSYDKERSEA